jgi:hypothetical protein
MLSTVHGIGHVAFLIGSRRAVVATPVAVM